MDFADILDKWEGGRKETCVPDKDAELEQAAASSPVNRRRLRAKKPDAVIDLHGLTADEAWDALDMFFTNGKRNGFEKLLVIHGKGLHSRQDRPGGGEAILKKTCREFIERCPFAGESGHCPASEGGSGSTWVLLK